MEQILGILGSVGFNWHVALANFVNFLIILFIVNKFFFGKIGKTIEKRHQIIERGLSQASDAERMLTHAEEEKNKVLSAAQDTAQGIVRDAHAKGETLIATLHHDAEKEIAERLHALHEKEQTTEERTLDAFSKRAPELVAKLYKAALQKEMTEEENNAFIARIRI